MHCLLNTPIHTHTHTRMLTSVAKLALAGVAVHSIQAGSSMLTGVGLAFVLLLIAVLTLVARETHTAVPTHRHTHTPSICTQ